MQSQKKLKKMPKTGSMEVLLSQYLQTNDYNQIDNVLTIHDERVGLMFVRGVFPLLDILVMKLEANPRVGDCCFADV